MESCGVIKKQGRIGGGLFKSQSAPCLVSLATPPTPPSTPIQRQHKCQSVASGLDAIPAEATTMPAPQNVIEHIGFQSMLRVPVHTWMECSMQYEFPHTLIERQSPAQQSLAACLASPSDTIEQIEPPHAHMSSLRAATSCAASMERYNTMLYRISRQRRRKATVATIANANAHASATQDSIES